VIVNNTTNINNLLTITISIFFCFVDLGGIVDYHYIHFRLFCWSWSPRSTKQKKIYIVIVNNSTKINKIKENLYSVNFLLFCSSWWNCWLSLYNFSFVLLILVELLTITISIFFCFVDLGGIVDYHYIGKKIYIVIVDNSTKINKAKENWYSDSQQFHQDQQNKRKFI
jgi:hypothetical protein